MRHLLRAFAGALILCAAALNSAHATITSTSTKVVGACNGATTSFNFSFVGAAAADIVVTLTSSTGVPTVLTSGTQYTLTLNAPPPNAIWGVGGSVLYPLTGPACPTGSTITIARSVPYIQVTPFANQGPNLPQATESVVDLLTMQAQQLNTLFSGALVQPTSDTQTFSPLPAAAARANLALCFDSTGYVPTACSVPASGSISSAMQPVVSAGSLAAGRAAFGLGSAATEAIGSYGMQDDGAGNLRQSFPITSDATNQSVTGAFHLTQRICTGPITYTLPRANTLWNGFGFWVTAVASTCTLAPNAFDNFQGNSSGTAIVIPAGASVFVTTNAASTGTWLAPVIPAGSTPPQGYLTLVTGRPVITADVTGVSTIYYTAFNGNTVPIWTGSQTIQMPFTSDLALTLTSGNNLANTAYDDFIIVSSGALTHVAGPAWRNSGQAITGATNANPIVITANGHGLQTGDTAVIHSVQGNTAANGTWTVTRVDANTFSLNGSTGNGAYTSTTGQFASRGAGGTTTQLTRSCDGFLRNANQITATSGASTYTVPMCGGLYVGSFYVDGSAGQVSAQRSYGQSRRWDVWNAYNRQPIFLQAGDSTASWTYATNAWRSSNNNAANTLGVFIGLPEEPADATFLQRAQMVSASAQSATEIGIGISSTGINSGTAGSSFANLTGTVQAMMTARYTIPPSMGFTAVNALEDTGSHSTSETYYGTQTLMLLTALWRG